MNGYVNLFGQEDREPGAKPEKQPPPARIEPAFVVGSRRIHALDVVWVQDGEEKYAYITAEQAKDAALRHRASHAITGARESPADTSTGTAKAPHVRGSATSEAAARKMDRKLAGKRLALLRSFCLSSADTGATDNELIGYMVKYHHWNANTPRARRTELVTDGWLEDSGERRNGSIVWRATDKTIQWWRRTGQGR